jgi:hypothetical protein
MQGSSDVWALIITDGTIVEFSVEVYVDGDRAQRESERWASALSDIVHQTIVRPFEGRWEVGGLDVRLVKCTVDSFNQDDEWWVGTHWTADGYPEPEALLLPGRPAARDWVLVQPGDLPVMSFDDGREAISAAYGVGDGESFSVAHLAKVIGTGRRHPTDVTYDVEITGTFVQLINGQVFGPPGLSQEAIERLIEDDWAQLSAEAHVLLESSWTLESYRVQHPSESSE